MQRSLTLAAVGVLALAVQGTAVPAQNLVGATQVSKDGRLGHVKGRALSKSLRGRTLPRNYARFTRYRYSARHRCWFCFTRNKWYYWYDPFQRYLPVAVIANYPPTVYAAAPVALPSAATPPVVAPPTDVPPTNAPLVRPRPAGSLPPPPVAPAARPVGPPG
jgi:hypothetical protein